MGGSASSTGSKGRGSRGSTRSKSGRERDRRAAIRALDKAARDNRANQLNRNNPEYKGTTSTSTHMTSSDAQRIQSHADRTETNQEFKSRAMRAAAKNEDD